MSDSEPLPSPPPTLEIVSAQCAHTIMVVESVSRRVEHFDDRIEDLKSLGKSLQSVSLSLSSTALRLYQTVNPVPRGQQLLVAGLAALAGGFLAQLVIFVFLK